MKEIITEIPGWRIDFPTLIDITENNSVSENLEIEIN